ncbi:MAG: spermidine synthase, partial [Candidatus Acidiferrales bacterium]
MRPLLALLLLSSAVLAYQIALMRAFSISLWHHFAYMVISIALLGFGASGTFLALWRRREQQTAEAFAAFAALFALSLPVSFAVAQRIPFNPFLLLWEPRQLLGLSLYYLVLFVPFFLAATAIGLLLVARAREAPRVYFFNLLGSGLGSLLAVIFLFLVPAERSVLLIYALAAGAALLVAEALPRLGRAAVVLSLVAAFYAFHLGGFLAIHPSQYKGLSTALNLPGAEILAQRSSPLGRVDILRSPAFRHAPGLSLVSPALPPPQLGVFIDAESAGAFTAFDDRRESVEFLDWTSAAAHFNLHLDSHGRRVLVLGAGGGADVLLALYHGAARPAVGGARVDAVELNPHLIALARREFAGFTGHLFHRPQVSIHFGEARAFLERAARGSPQQFDLIQISLLDSLAASAAGVTALDENYLYTVEALDRATGLLSPDGVLAITRWLKMPPRDSLKLFLTAVAALEARGATNPGDHLAFVRSWATGTLLIKRSPFTPGEIAALKQFCEERLFDLDYFPGIRPEDANRFNRLDRSYYFEAARDILAGPDRRAALLRDYPFNLAPATDDRPFFQHFFRWRALPLLLEAYGRQGLPFLEWG